MVAVDQMIPGLRGLDPRTLRKSASDKGKRWVERTLSLRHTCRQLGQSTFRILVDAVTSWCGGRPPARSWLSDPSSPSLPPGNAYKNSMGPMKTCSRPGKHETLLGAIP